MNVIGIIVLSFFALIGAAAFLSAMFRENTADKECALLLEHLTADKAEMRIRRAAKLCDRIGCQRLICRCSDVEAEQICERLTREYRIIELS